MKILFCTNVFEIVENGPVKFANLLLQINELYTEHEVRILTEDVSTPRRYVHKVPLSEQWKSSPLSQFVRMWAYHHEAIRLRKDFPFDVLVYNNALVGLWSAIRLPNCVGMINDYKNASKERDYYQKGFRSFKERIFRIVEKISAAHYRTIITNSDYLTKLIETNYPGARGKVFRLYKSVELPDSPVLFRPVCSEPIRILFIKTDYELGGLRILIEAISLLRTTVVLTVIGPKGSHRLQIEALCQSAPNLSLRFLHYQPQPAVIKELRASDLLCVPSYKEALGVANLEAMAHGIPVVSTNVGGIPEVLDQGRCGWMVPPGNARALAQGVEECILQPDMRKQKIENALIQVRKFDTTTLFDNFLKILSQ